MHKVKAVDIRISAVSSKSIPISSVIHIQSKLDIRISMVSSETILISSVILISNGFVWKLDFGQQQKYSYNERYSYIQCTYIQLWLYWVDLCELLILVSCKSILKTGDIVISSVLISSFDRIRISLVNSKHILISSVILISCGFVWKPYFGPQQKYCYNKRYYYIQCFNNQLWLY